MPDAAKPYPLAVADPVACGDGSVPGPAAPPLFRKDVPAFSARQLHRKRRKPSASARSSIVTPVLISAISNIVVGLFWLAPCFTFPLTILMAILCIFEFSFYARADRMSASQLANEGFAIGIFEILLGLFNIVSFICGILVLINSSKIGKRR